MNFLKSVLSSAGGFPGYSLLDKIDVPPNCLYSLNNATRREGSLPCSVLTFETAKAPTLLPLAKNYLSKLRSLKHPGVVKYLASHEIDGWIYIAVERIVPLSHTLSKTPGKDLLIWGLYDVAQTISFINSEASSIHGNVRPSSIFTNEAGEWKLSGFEGMTCMKDEDPFILRYGGLVPDIYPITPPELQNKGFSELKSINLTALDSWQFGCLVWTCFNGQFSSTTSLSSQGKIPGNMLAQYRRLLTPNPAPRLAVANFVDFGRRAGGFFRSELINISEAIPDLPLKSKMEVEAFLETNMKAIATLPAGYKKHKLLPEMIKSLEFGGGGVTALRAILTITKDLAPADIEVLVAPMLLRIWSGKDRATYLVLLENLKDYIEYLSPRQINDKLFQSLGSAFSDPAPILRETAIRQIMILTPYLSDRNINGDLLKYLAKTANDQQPGIRTNTTICLGKIADHLGASNRRKVLTAAFSRSLKDPFVHARMASLQAINATSDVYEKDDLATRLLPGTVPLLIDGEKVVRDQAKKTMTTLLSRLEVLVQDMPETLLPPTSGQISNNDKSSGTTAAIETAGMWAGWAVSTLSRNIDSGSLPTATAAAATATTTNSSTPVTRSSTPVTAPRAQTPVMANSSRPPVVVRKSSASTVQKKGGSLKLAAPSKSKVDVSSLYAAEAATQKSTESNGWDVDVDDWQKEDDNAEDGDEWNTDAW